LEENRRSRSAKGVFSGPTSYGRRRRAHQPHQIRHRADATYIWIESNQCIRCGNCNRRCPTYAIPIRKADIKSGPIKEREQ